MNRRQWLINAAGGSGTLIAQALLTSRPDAAHFSWLGHTKCPGELAQCEIPIPAEFKALGDFDIGFYRTLDETAAEWRGEERSETLFTREGHMIARVGVRFRRQLEIEGSARLRDGRFVSVEGKVDGRPRFLVIEHAPFGVGAPGYKLMPHRTVSVDPKRVPLGTVLFIPALVGVRLPTGTFHDGFCFAHDTHDGAPDGMGIFTGFDRTPDRTFLRLAMKTPLRVYQADPVASAVLNRRFKDQFDWAG